MTWLTAALLSTALFAVVAVFDKRMVADLFPSFATFNVTFGLLQFVIAPVFLVAVTLTVGFDGGSGIPWAIGSGLLWALGLSLFFYGLRTEEVSRAAPTQSLAPVFAAVIAVVFLHEQLSGLQWLAILVVAVGAGMVSLRPENGRIRLAHGRTLAILVVSALFIAIAFAVTKEATDRMNVWAIQGFRAMAMGVGVLVLTWRPSMNGELWQALRSKRAVIAMVVSEGLMAPVAAFCLTLAFSLGTVSVVGAVTASRPLALLVISTALSTRVWNVLNEPLDRQTVGLKAVSTGLIVVGVVALALL
jgi:uncharacterized membrane protein